MTAEFLPPEPDAILVGPQWPNPVKVVAANIAGDAVRIRAVSTLDAGYTDLTIPVAVYRATVTKSLGGVHSFDASPRLFRLGTEALRTHLAHVFDPQFAVSVSQVDPLPHQIEAVYKRILPLPTIRFLLADDPGAGKTIMAGLLMRELMQREEVTRVLVLCPKALTDQWRREMWERFKQRFTLVTGETIGAAFGQNVWAETNLVIASVDLGVQPHILPGLEESRWDLVIFDEAHKLSAYNYSGKIEKTRRYLLAEKLAARTKHLLLMTATPHRGDPENFRLLLSLLDPEVFGSAAGTDRAVSSEGSPYFLRRMKETMTSWEGKPLFLARHVITPPYNLSLPEKELYDAVTAYVRDGIALAEQAPQSRVRRNVGLALTILQRRLASSVFAVTRSLERRQEKLSAELERLRRTGASAVEIDIPATDFDEDEDDPEELDEVLSGASAVRSVAELQAEVEHLGVLVAMARARMAAPERKLQEFLRLVDEQTVRVHDEKVLVFTEHRDTLTYLVGKLRERGLRVTSIHGGMKLQDRIAAEKEFRGPAQFMVATDAAGEGINLQFCKVMLNWDLPWNPNRLEQRMGRIHRYGQKFEVQIFNLVASDTREGQVLHRLMEKLESMRAALGHDQVFDVISEVLDVGKVRLDWLMRDAILQRRSMDEVLGELEVLDSDGAKQAAREALGEALATRYIDMAFLMGEDRESRERRLTPEFVERFFIDGLEFLGGRIQRIDSRTLRLEHVPAEIRRAVGAANTGEVGADDRVITFVKARATDAEPTAEFVAPDHPLFDAVTDRVLAAGRPALSAGTVFIDPAATQPSLVWLLEAAVVNGSGQAVHRRLLGLRQVGTSFEPVEAGVVLDLAPADTAPHIPADLSAAADGEAAITAASAYYTQEYLRSVSEQQEREVEIVSSALERSVSDTLEKLQGELERQTADAERGRDMGIAIRTTNQRIDALVAERDRRRADLSRRRTLSLDTPRVVGVAAVLPGPVPAAWEKGAGGDKTAIELAGMRHAMEFERACGRAPDDVSKRGVGYDIKSTAHGGAVRYIEVKAHTTAGDVSLYYTEWQMANRLREEFFIYEVDYALTAPALRIIQDPVGKGIEPVEKVVEYRIAAAKLTAHAVPAEWPR